MLMYATANALWKQRHSSQLRKIRRHYTTNKFKKFYFSSQKTIQILINESHVGSSQASVLHSNILTDLRKKGRAWSIWEKERESQLAGWHWRPKCLPRQNTSVNQHYTTCMENQRTPPPHIPWRILQWKIQLTIRYLPLPGKNDSFPFPLFRYESA